MLNSKFTWVEKRSDSAYTGGGHGTICSLDSTWNEALVYISHSDVHTDYYIVHVVKAFGNKRYLVGYQTGFAEIYVDGNDIKAYQFLLSGSAYTPYIAVYQR
jgi:hypothetical protein